MNRRAPGNEVDEAGRAGDGFPGCFLELAIDPDALARSIGGVVRDLRLMAGKALVFLV